MTDLVVVKAKVKDFAEGCNVASDFAEELSNKVKVMIKEAAKRAKANNRKTIQPKDL